MWDVLVRIGITLSCAAFTCLQYSCALGCMCGFACFHALLLLVACIMEYYSFDDKHPCSGLHKHADQCALSWLKLAAVYYPPCVAKKLALVVVVS
jgi:hypothetical protein